MNLISINSATITQYYLTSGITAGQRYRFRVIANNIVGASSPSSFLEMMPASVPGSPTTPTILAQTSSSLSV